jgi:hypothetical protein
MNGKAYCAVAPVVSTLSSITEGVVTPVRTASDRAGNIYVTDPRGGGILKYNSAGNLLQKIGASGGNLLGIAIANNGDILVSQGNVVAVYSPAGVKTGEFGTFGRANGIAVDDTGAVFVVDSKNNNVQSFSAAYAPIATFGSTGSGNGQFKQPTGIAFEKLSRQLAVVDTLNGRVQFFNTSGTYQKTVGSFGAGPLKFTSPQAVAFEYTPDGSVLSRMYVVDSFQANVQVIDAVTTAFLRYISSYGTRVGQMVTPGDLLLDPFNRLIIPNGTGAIAVFGVEAAAPPSGAGGTTFTPPSTGNTPPTITLNPLNAVTKTSSITLSGTVTTGSTVSVNGTAANVDANGNWSASVSLPKQGLNNFMIIASRDSSTSSISVYVTLDTSAPVLNVFLFPPTGSTTSTPIQMISGSVSDITATTVTVTLNGVSRAVPVNDGLFETAIVLGNGSNIVSITATDTAGITSPPYSSTVIYDPLAPSATVATPGGAVTGSASYTVTGTAPLNSQVTVNGIPATMTAPLAKTLESGVQVAAAGTQWTATIPLHSGVNQINIAVSVAGNPVVSTTISSVTYAPGQPLLAITSPFADIATARASAVVSGTTNAGNTIMATMNGVAIPVRVSSDGSFILSLPEFTAPGTYIVLFTAIDTNGKMSATSRTLFFDPATPVLTVVDANPSSIKVRSSGGVIVAKDKSGMITTPNNSNGTAFLDLSGAVYDQQSLNIYALSPAGISSRNGDLNGDGNVDIGDALLALQVSIGLVQTATFEQLLRGDVAPLVTHVPVPDGKIRIDDAVLILQKAIGIEW